jgi:hypothetical protein
VELHLSFVESQISNGVRPISFVELHLPSVVLNLSSVELHLSSVEPQISSGARPISNGATSLSGGLPGFRSKTPIKRPVPLNFELPALAEELFRVLEDNLFNGGGEDAYAILYATHNLD